MFLPQAAVPLCGECHGARMRYTGFYRAKQAHDCAGMLYMYVVVEVEDVHFTLFGLSPHRQNGHAYLQLIIMS
jgi:hypothetical protein